MMTFLWYISTLSKPNGKIVIPNLFPWIFDEVAYGLIERLARDHITVWFDTHVIASGGTTLNSKLHLDRIEMTVLRWCVPD